LIFNISKVETLVIDQKNDPKINQFLTEVYSYGGVLPQFIFHLYDFYVRTFPERYLVFVDKFYYNGNICDIFDLCSNIDIIYDFYLQSNSYNIVYINKNFYIKIKINFFLSKETFLLAKINIENLPTFLYEKFYYDLLAQSCNDIPIHIKNYIILK